MGQPGAPGRRLLAQMLREWGKRASVEDGGPGGVVSARGEKVKSVPLAVWHRCAPTAQVLANLPGGENKANICRENYKMRVTRENPARWHR